ncbi:tRNA pseudouridine(55) synthase TruB [Legionella sp.]|uniref:tRNA pseudouridine(55) synthase TruB n=1 Tax=Legionella sp. TaxID=459 RepID=UPI0032203BEA
MIRVECNQTINGIILVNKPQGLSSNTLLQQVRRLFRAKKAGHTGSLDPLATGMLPICFGEATKFCQYLLDADKCYEATGLLGVKTNTGDALGEVIKTISSFALTESDMLAALKQFTGTIKQTPSMFSALKHKGTPLYKYAREGITLERPAREITIHALELMAFNGKQFDIKVSCSKGTYIRNLVEDIGDLLGVGAHVTKLHRLSTAGFDMEIMYTLDELQQKNTAELIDCLLPMERAVNYLPRLNVSVEEVSTLRQGKRLNRANQEELKGCIRLYHNDCFIGLGEISAGNLSVKRLLAF